MMPASYQHDTTDPPASRLSQSVSEGWLRLNGYLRQGSSSSSASSSSQRHQQISDELFEFEESQYSRTKRRSDLIVMLLLWVGCLLLGLFYFRESSCCDHRYGLSFYMAVNVFYAIGWSHPTNDSDTLRYFSSFYLVVGTIFFYTAVSYFINLMVEQNTKHYADIIAVEAAVERAAALEKHGAPGVRDGKRGDLTVDGGSGGSGAVDEADMRAAADRLLNFDNPAATTTAAAGAAMLGAAANITATEWALRFVHLHGTAVLDFCMLGAWVVWGIAFGVIVIEWTFSEALYFSLSTLSAGGMYSVPQVRGVTSCTPPPVVCAWSP